LGSASQAADYETITSFLINYVKKNYKGGTDIATALKKGEEFDFSGMMPVLKFSEKDADDPLAIGENCSLKLIFQKELKEYLDQKKQYKNNKNQVYALFFERCSRSMQQKIQALSNFDTEIEDNPIKLLQAIKQHQAPLDYQDNKYKWIIIIDALMAFMNCRQQEGESLQDFTSHFKTARELFVSHFGGPLIVQRDVEQMKDMMRRTKMSLINAVNYCLNIVQRMCT
jgi:hypothetical protein